MHSACVRLEHCRRAESNGRERGKGGAACSVGYMEAVEAEVPKQVEQNQQPRLGDISLCRRVPHAVMLSHRRNGSKRVIECRATAVVDYGAVDTGSTSRRPVRRAVPSNCTRKRANADGPA